MRKNAAYNTRLTLFFTALLLLLASCSNSKLVVGGLYDRLDNQIRSEFNKLGKFNSTQKADFEARLQTFHFWHRRQEMPQYAQFLRTVKKTVSLKGATDQLAVKRWFGQIEDFADKAQGCYPVHYSLDLIKTLRDDQVDFIQRRFQRERKKNREKRKSSTRAERVEKRIKKVTKWSSRVGFTFTNRQKRMLRETMFSTTSLYDEYYALSEKWNQRTFTVVRARDNPAFEIEMRKQLGSMFRMVESQHPIDVAENRKLWRDFSLKFVQSMTADQRVWVNAWIGKLANTLDKIGKDRVSYKPHKDANIGCIVDATS